jgi:predicted RNase H-like HicB family nuclease
MRYPIAIEPGSDQHAFGVVVPDLPGCFSAGDTVEEAIANSEEAILLWLEDVFEAKEEIPEPQAIDVHRANPEFEGWLWALVNVEPAKVMGPAERVNITIPKRALAQIDIAAERAGESRSSFLVTSALRQMRRTPEASTGKSTKAGVRGKTASSVRSARKTAASGKSMKSKSTSR